MTESNNKRSRKPIVKRHEGVPPYHSTYLSEAPVKARKEMIIVVKTLPPSKNVHKNWHWAKKRRFGVDMQWEIFVEMRKQKCKPEKAFSKVELTFRLYFKTDAKRDSQNYIAGGLIEVIDAMVDLNIITDDNHKVIGSPKVEVYVDKKNPRMEIVIKED